jgi:CheY-like chemotaxis protein
MDMHLPDMDGCQAAKLIRRAGFTLPIIALTADDTQASTQKCFDAGMNEYLCKSLDCFVLEAVLKRWMPEARQPTLKTHPSEELSDSGSDR